MRGARGACDALRRIDRRRGNGREMGRSVEMTRNTPLQTKRGERLIRRAHGKHSAPEVDLAGHGSEIQSRTEDEVITRWPL